MREPNKKVYKLFSQYLSLLFYLDQPHCLTSYFVTHWYYDYFSCVGPTNCCTSVMVLLFAPLLLQPLIFTLLLFLIPESTFVLLHLQIGSS